MDDFGGQRLLDCAFGREIRLEAGAELRVEIKLVGTNEVAAGVKTMDKRIAGYARLSGGRNRSAGGLRVIAIGGDLSVSRHGTPWERIPLFGLKVAHGAGEFVFFACKALRIRCRLVVNGFWRGWKFQGLDQFATRMSTVALASGSFGLLPPYAGRLERSLFLLVGQLGLNGDLPLPSEDLQDGIGIQELNGN